MVSFRRNKNEKRESQQAGFEPTRGNPNGFQVHRLDRSATVACCMIGKRS